MQQPIARNNHEGETNTMSNGMNATIIRYRKSIDIDVQFEDGAIVQHRRYQAFQLGYIAHPSKPQFHVLEQNIANRVGQERTMNNGMKCKIVAYRGNADVDVQFEDGTVVQHRTYADFLGGRIANPQIKRVQPQEEAKIHPTKEQRLRPKSQRSKTVHDRQAEERIGKTLVMNNRMAATITAYRRADDLDVLFEDGTIVQHRSYYAFLKGRIAHPNCSVFSAEKETESHIMRNGLKCKIIEYRTSRDVDVQFEDGAIVQHIRVSRWRAGRIVHPQGKCVPLPPPKPGTTKRMRDGMVCTAMSLQDNNKLCVCFEGGLVLPDCNLHDFYNGNIRYPGDPSRIAEKYQSLSCINEEGLMCRIAEFKNMQNVTVLFEDGKTVANVSYAKFAAGKVLHPLRKNHVGESMVLSDGHTGTIVAWHGRDKADVKLDDGSVRTNQNYMKFKAGILADFSQPKPHRSVDHKPKMAQRKGPKFKSERVGESQEMSNGMNGEIVAYRSCTDIDVRFEDGYVEAGTRYRFFHRGMVNHPVLTSRVKGCLYFGYTLQKLVGMIRGQMLYEVIGEHGQRAIQSVEYMQMHPLALPNDPRWQPTAELRKKYQSRYSRQKRESGAIHQVLPT